MKKFKFYLFLLLVIIFSCKGKHERVDEKTKNKIIELGLKIEPNLIQGEIIKIDGLVLPNKMSLQDSILFIKDSRAEKFVHLVDLKNKIRLTSFGVKGKGPGELLSAFSMDFYNNNLWVHDITLGKLVSFNKDSLLINLNSSYNYSNEIQFKEKARQNANPTWINDTVLVSTTLSESLNRLMFTDKEGVVSYEDFIMISPEKEDTPRAIHNQSYQALLKRNPNQSKIALVNRYSDLLEIYDLKEKESKLLKTHQNFTPIYEVVNADGDIRMVQDETTRFGYIDISVTKDKIFTLYSGRTRGEGFANYANNVHVYNWKGEHLKSYQLPNLAISILAENNNSLLTLEYKGGIPMLKRYTLDEK